MSEQMFSRHVCIDREGLHCQGGIWMISFLDSISVLKRMTQAKYVILGRKVDEILF